MSRERDRVQAGSGSAAAERLAWKAVWILAESLSDTATPVAAKRPPADASRAGRQADKHVPGGPAAKGDARTTDPWERWLYNYYAGEGRPSWIGPLRGPLEKMLRAEAAEERMAAAAALVPLGRADLALPEVRRSLTGRKFFHEAAALLPWLPWKDREELFGQLCLIAGKDDWYRLIELMSQPRDPRAAEVFWQLLVEPKLSLQAASCVETGLLMTYLRGNVYSYDPTNSSNSSQASMARKQQEFFRALKPRAASGAERQRMVAIALLTYAVDDGAVEVVQRVRDDATLSAELRRDALQVLLAMKSKKEAERLAVSVMEDKEPASRKLGVQYLVEGREGLEASARRFP